ncbi:MAG TPA: hypothetical protein VMT38_02490 [Terracidiphilus sp.]|nr:hypothetical protein [Terracidiphilus sp.]
MRSMLRFLGPLRSPVIVSCAVLTLAAAAYSQKKSGGSGGSGGFGGFSASSSAPQSSTTSDEDNSGKGFAIESEMMTYTAMDAEGTALACNLGKNVGAADASCNAQAINGPPVGVVVVSGDSSAISEFQLWRTDVSTMDMLTQRADHYCPQGGSRAATSLSSQLMSMFPESQAASFALSLLSQTAQTHPLEGNILDQTLVDDVAGHLRALGLDVVIPDTYMPNSLAAVDIGHSPFLTKYVGLLRVRACVAGNATENQAPGAEPGSSGNAESDAHTAADKRAITEAIDGYLKSLTEPDVFDSPKPPAGAPPESQRPVISHLNAVMRADGLAQELQSASSNANGVWYVLSVKALESGGTLMKSGNGFTGTKTSYSGGAVGTYAFFKLNGGVACSGVFFNYEAPTLTSKIPGLLNSTQPTEPGKLVGGCH